MARIKTDECHDKYHDACPGGPAVKGGIGILCECPCHITKKGKGVTRGDYRRS